MIQVIIDTNVFVAALISETGASREVIRRCLQKSYQPCISLALFAEYQDLMGRHELFASCPLTEPERKDLFCALMSVSRMTDIYYLWRPNLPDEGDNHVIELAVAAGAKAIVTHNRADFRRAELRFPDIKILSPADLLKEYP